MKKPKGVSLEESLYERVRIAAKKKRESASKWIEDAIYERFESMNATVKDEQKTRRPQLGKFLQLGAAIACALSLSGRSNLCYGKGLPRDGRDALDPVNHIYRQI